MKKTILILFFLIGLTSYSQEVKDEVNSENSIIKCKVSKDYHDENKIVFEESVSYDSNNMTINNAEKLILDKNTNEITVFGLKKINIDTIIKIQSAEKLIFDKNTNKITVFGLRKFNIDAIIKIQNDEKSRKNGLLEYTLGEKIAYLR